MKKIILILGCMTALSPFSIDMYLSAFPMMAKYFNTTVAHVSVTLSSYFVGLASGQLIYGPLMDRFGRKKPLLMGLGVYILASFACTFVNTVDQLIVLRVIQAMGGCSASVAAFAMVRDLFSPKESAKVLSTLILILGASPLLAPTVGGFLATNYGWKSVFTVLTVGSFVLTMVVAFILPESHKGDKAHILKPGPIARNYFLIMKNPVFYTYALAGAVGFSGLFVYLAASPTIFMEIFGVSEQVYGWIFAFIAAGLIGTSQLNVVLLKKFSNEQILFCALSMLTLTSVVFFICAFNGWYNVYSVIGTMFVFLSCIGLSNPNSTAIAMAPFGSKAGSAASMIGFLQMSIGAMASVIVGILKAQALFPLAAIFVGTSVLSLAIFTLGNRSISRESAI